MKDETENEKRLLHEPEAFRSCTVGIETSTGQTTPSVYLRHSEEKFAACFSKNPIPMAITAMEDGRYIEVNEAFAKVMGCVIEELVGKTSMEAGYINAEQRDSFLAEFRQKGFVENLELQVRAKGGELRYGLFNSSKIRIGGRDYFLTSVTDITNRKRTEEALRESEEKYRLLLDESTDPIFSFTPDGRYLYANKAFADGVAKEIDHIVGHKIWDVFSQEEADKRFSALDSVFQSGKEKIIEVRVPRPDGDRFYITTITPIKDERGKVIIAICSSKDIKDRKLAEVALKESEAKYRTLIETTSTGFVIIDQGGIVLDANQEYASLAGFTQAREIIGRRATDWLAAYERVKNEEAVSVCLQNGHIRNLEIDYVDSKGNITPLEMNATCLEVDGAAHILMLCRNISDRKQAEEERIRLQERLQRADKMEALGTLAGGVAHDLNNVLGVLVGYSELLLHNMPVDSPLRNHVEKLLNGGVRAAAIVQDLLTLARRSLHSESVVHLNDVIADFQKTLEFENLCSSYPRIRIKTILANNLLNIKGSPSHISKTFMNLLSNAVEAISGGGLVTVMTKNCHLDRPVRGYDDVREGDYVLLSVSDTGEGISAADIKHIFEPFYTKKVMGRSGTGLGLAVVWGTVKDHRGYIDVQCEKDQGTTFTLYFPVTREERASFPIVTPLSEYMGKGESILVVDDIQEQRELAASMLGTLNYKVATVAGGEEAVEYLKSHQADLLVLDMIMDPGMDGLDTYKRILAGHPKQKAIIASGFSSTDRVREMQILGAGAYVKKPYMLERLGLAVRSELDK